MGPSGRAPARALWRPAPAQGILLLILALLLACPKLAPAFDGPILIRGGTVVHAEEGETAADVLLRDGLIERVGTGIAAPAGAHIIDAHGMYVMPGGIDPHTHLDMPFMGQTSCDDFASGQAAALAGGTTFHIDFALPLAHDLRAGLEAYRRRASSSVMDYGFHMAVTSWSEAVAADMEHLVQHEGINSFKFFLAYKGALMVSDAELLRGLLRCKQLGALAMVHAENGDGVALGQERMVSLGITGPEGHALSRPPVLEGEATGRAIRLARFVGAPLYVVHVMSDDAVREIFSALEQGQLVIGEAVISGLAHDESRMWDANFTTAAAHVMSPPIRSPQHREKLREALAKGVLQLVATDHASFNSTQKAAGAADFRLIPNGVNGIEERLHVLWDLMINSGRMTTSDFVRISSSAAAHIFNVFPRKGVIAAGSDADVIVLDPKKRHVIRTSAHHSRSDTNIYDGWEVQGQVVVTISRGRIVWEHGRLKNLVPGSGRYVPLPPNGPLFKDLEKRDVTPVPYPTPVDRSRGPAVAVAGGAAGGATGAAAGTGSAAEGGEEGPPLPFVDEAAADASEPWQAYKEL